MSDSRALSCAASAGSMLANASASASFWSRRAWTSSTNAAPLGLCPLQVLEGGGRLVGGGLGPLGGVVLSGLAGVEVLVPGVQPGEDQTLSASCCMPTIDALSEASPVGSAAMRVESRVGGRVDEGVHHDTVALPRSGR